jgi:hypothetical protein
MCYVSLWYGINLAEAKLLLDIRELEIPNEPINLYVGYRMVLVKG